MLTFQQFLFEEMSTVALNEINMSRLSAHMNGRNIGMITASRGEHQDHPDWAKYKDLPKEHPDRQAFVNKVNKQRNKELEGHIKHWTKTQRANNNSSAGYTKVRGRYTENFGKPDAHNVDEHSFLMIGKKGDDRGELKKFLTHHGEKYNQDSILHKAHDSTAAHLVGTNKTGYPGYGQHRSIGEFHANRTPEFHSILHGGGANSGKQGAKTIRQKGSGKTLARTGSAGDKTWAVQK